MGDGSSCTEISDLLAQDQPRASGGAKICFHIRAAGVLPWAPKEALPSLCYLHYILCPAATWSSKVLRKGNVELGFPLHVCHLSPCPVFIAKRRPGRARGRCRVLVSTHRTVSEGASNNLWKPEHEVSACASLKHRRRKASINTLLLQGRMSNRGKQLGVRQFLIWKKVQYVTFPPLLGDLERQMPFASCLKEAKLFL